MGWSIEHLLMLITKQCWILRMTLWEWSIITIEILPGLDFTNGVIAKGFRFAIGNTSACLRSMTFNILEEIGRLRCIYMIVNCIMLYLSQSHQWQLTFGRTFARRAVGRRGGRRMSFTHLLLASGCRHLLGVLTHLLGRKLQWFGLRSLLLREQNQPQGNFPRSGWKWPEGLLSQKRLHSRPEAPHSQPRPRPCIGSVLRCWPRW